MYGTIMIIVFCVVFYIRNAQQYLLVEEIFISCVLSPITV